MDDKSLHDTFSEKLKLIMMGNNISQRDLSKMTGFTEASISRYIKGERLPRIPEIISIADALYVSRDYL